MIIYSIQNTANGNLYIGQTQHAMISRWKDHLKKLRNGSHKNHYLLRAFRKYGENCFNCETLEEHPSVESCDQAENFLIRYLKFIGASLYNLTEGGGRKGWNLSPEARKRIGEASSKRVCTAEQRSKLSASLKGRTSWNKGKTNLISEAGRKNIGDATRLRHRLFGHPCTGKIRSEETKKKISIAKLGKPSGLKGKFVGSLHWNYGKPLGDKQRIGMLLANTGKHRSAETRAKISSSRIALNLKGIPWSAARRVAHPKTCKNN